MTVEPFSTKPTLIVAISSILFDFLVCLCFLLVLPGFLECNLLKYHSCYGPEADVVLQQSQGGNLSHPSQSSNCAFLLGYQRIQVRNACIGTWTLYFFRTCILCCRMFMWNEDHWRRGKIARSSYMQPLEIPTICWRMKAKDCTRYASLPLLEIGVTSAWDVQVSS